MVQQTEISRLRDIVDEAIVYADEAGLAFVVRILEIARLELDQSTDFYRESMPIDRPFGKPP